MARISGTTALRAALGGIAGGLRGLGAMREEQRLLAQQEEARKRQLAADARQAAMDQVGLFNQGFMTGEETAGERQRTGAALSRALSSATAMMAPGAGMGGAMPSLQPGDVRSTAAAPGLESPQQRVTLGGVNYQRESPFAKAAREAEQEVNRARMADEATQATQRQTREQQKRALVGMGLSEDQAEAALSMGAKYDDLQMSPAEKARQAAENRRISLEERRLGLTEQQFKAQQAAGGAAKKSATAPLQAALPSVVAAAERLNQMTAEDAKKMSAFGVGATNVMQQEGGTLGQAVGAVGGLARDLGVPIFTNRDLEYVELTGAIADAVARASEVGVLTNFDINRFRNQIIFQSIDTDESKARKLERARSWANWLANNKQAIDEGNVAGISQPPADYGRFLLKQEGQAAGGPAGQAPQARFDQLVQRGMDSTGAASLVNEGTQAANVGAFPSRVAPMRTGVSPLQTGVAPVRSQVAPVGQQQALTPAQWMAANPQLPGESRQAYIARGKAATGGR